MWVHRILAARIAFALPGLDYLALTASASASDSASASAEAAKRKPLFKGKEPRKNKLIVFGKVTDNQRSKVTLEKKNCDSCTWYKATDFKTNESIRFSKRVYGPGRGTQQVCYRVKTPVTRNFAATRSDVLCIVKL